MGGQRVDQADVRAFRRFDRADAAIVRRVHVADFEARALARQTARAKRRKATLVGDFRQRVRLVHELRQLRRTEELANRGGGRLGVDQVVRHDCVDIDRRHALLDGALHPQQADAVLVFQQLADRTDPAVAQVVDVVDLAPAVLQADQNLQHLQHVFLAKDPDLVGDLGAFQTHVHLDPADGRQVVAFAVEEQRVEHGLGGFRGGRLARTHHAIDVEQGVLAVVVLIDAQGVAHIGADRDVVDVQHLDGGEAVLLQHFDGRGVQFVAGLGVDFAGLEVHRVIGQIFGQQGVGGQRKRRRGVAQLLGGARADLLAGLGDHFAGVGVDQVELRLHTAPALGLVRRDPTLAALLVGHGLVEGLQDFLAVHAQPHQEGRGRQLAAAVDADIDHVLGVELEVQPRPAVRDHAGGEQQLARGVRLALVVIEEDARRAVHLRHDHALGAVDDEGALVRHERDVAHIDVLLLDVLDRTGSRFLVGLEHDQAQLDLQRRGIGHVALNALLDVVLRLFELVRDVFQDGAFVEVLDREHRLEDRLDALLLALARTDLTLQELFVGGALNLDQVRHRHRFGNAPEGFADALLAGERGGGGDLTVDGEIVGDVSHSVFPMTHDPGKPCVKCSSHGAPFSVRSQVFGAHPRPAAGPGRLKCTGSLGKEPRLRTVGGRRTGPRRLRADSYGVVRERAHIRAFATK